MPRARPTAVALSTELADADLGDARLSRRLRQLVGSLAERPAESFPKVLDDAELEAAYRFFGNVQVRPGAILAPHFRQSARRAAELSRIVVAHDTTQFEFGGQTKRKGLGRLINPSAQGFFGHFSLAMSADTERRPLGLLALETVFRLKKSIGQKKWTKDQRIGESARWLRSVEAVEGQLGGVAQAIHVMDREADQYSLLAAMHAANRPFVIRSFQDRRLERPDEARLRAVASAAKVKVRPRVGRGGPGTGTCRSVRPTLGCGDPGGGGRG
jgi:Transposase DNA-binding